GVARLDAVRHRPADLPGSADRHHAARRWRLGGAPHRRIGTDDVLAGDHRRRRHPARAVLLYRAAADRPVAGAVDAAPSILRPAARHLWWHALGEGDLPAP